MSETLYLPDLPVDCLRARRRSPVDPETLGAAAAIVARVQAGGELALRALAEEHDGLPPGAPLVHTRPEVEAALARQPAALRELLQRTAARIERFAQAQREVCRDVEVAAEGMRMGHRVVAVDRAGCYVPGGRYAYPSTALMTAVTARVAGVREVWVASPAPGDLVLAAAGAAGADFVLAAGGAHAIAALAHGAGPVPACAAVVGPGNRWVTAAKQLVAGLARIDGLAGPSELTVMADRTADPERVAADLIAQAEHAPDAYPVLVTTCPDLVAWVRGQIAVQLPSLPTAEVASRSLAAGHSVQVTDLDEGVAVCEALAPEHLRLVVAEPGSVVERLRNYGALFSGDNAAEVFGDYGIGPNHTLPTGGTARAFSGLSVMTFLKFPTYVLAATDVDGQLVRDAVALAELEGLVGHAAAARARLPKSS